MYNVHEQFPVSHKWNDGRLRTSDVISSKQMAFSTLLLEPKIQDGLVKCDYEYLSPIQQSALPLALTGASIIAHAKSGTGKTLVYLLTALNNFLRKNSDQLQCLILAPTREIAKQIYDTFKNVGRYVEGLNVEYFIGGTPVDVDILKCRKCHIAIGAPGRIQQLIQLGCLKLQTLQLFVLDEVDALLMNKQFAITQLFSHLPSAIQAVVCTATYIDDIKEQMKWISPDIKYVTAKIIESNMNDCESITSNVLIGIKQYVAPVFKDSTSLDNIRIRRKLLDILLNFDYDQCFVFVNYVSLVKSICNLLTSNNLAATFISSEQNQSARINAVNQLKLKQCRILVTTDLASRGIDIHNVNLVVNVGLPFPPDVYIHRMGRAGRFGSEGVVITILHEGDEIETLEKLISAVATDPVKLYVLSSTLEKNSNDLRIIECCPKSENRDDIWLYFKKHTQSCDEKKKSKHKYVDKKKITASINEQHNDISKIQIAESCENMFRTFIASIKRMTICEDARINSNALRYMFESTGSNESDNLDKSLFEYASYIRKKNEDLDSVTFPYELANYLRTSNYDTIVADEISSPFSEVVKNLLFKIYGLMLCESEESKIYKKYTLSDELFNDDIEIRECAVKDQSRKKNRAEKSKNRTKKRNKTEKLDQNTNKKDDNSLLFLNATRSEADQSPNVDLLHDAQKTIPNDDDQFKKIPASSGVSFADVNRQRWPILPSLQMFTSARTENIIWQHHFNFIRNRVGKPFAPPGFNLSKSKPDRTSTKPT